jgi:hypothetical protein
MNYIPSPPNSPYLESYSSFDTNDSSSVMCGECNKSLGVDWFCSDCHKKCITCNRFLGLGEYCTRCWAFDPVNQQFFRKYAFYKFLSEAYNIMPATSSFTGLPSPSNSTESSSMTTNNDRGSAGPKLLTRPFSYNF